MNERHAAIIFKCSKEVLCNICSIFVVLNGRLVWVHSSGKQYEVYGRCMARRILVELDVAASVTHVLVVLIIIIIFGIHWFSCAVVCHYFSAGTSTSR